MGGPGRGFVGGREDAAGPFRQEHAATERVARTTVMAAFATASPAAR
ncbi:hypothetical protein ACWD00_22890 [Streptomyces viridiviolaceus]